MMQAEAERNPICNVVLACDDIMAMPLGVCIASIVSNKAPETRLAIHVISFGISRRNRARVLASAKTVPVVWHEIEETMLKRLQAFYRRSELHYPPASYARLLLADILPEEIARVLYLDVDTVVLADLAPVFSADMDGNTVLGCIELENTGVAFSRISRVLSDEDNARYAAAYDQPYINTGVLVIDLKSFGGESVDEMLSLIWKYPGLNYPDQDAINLVLSGNIGYLDPRWNQTNAVFLSSVEAAPPLPADAFEALQKRPFIVHFTGRPKPWHQGCVRPFREAWHLARADTPWARRQDTPVRRALAAIPRAKRLFFKKLHRLVSKKN